MHFLLEYGLYFAKIATLVIAILIVVAGIMALAARAKEKGKGKGKLIITKLNKKYDEMTHTIRHAVLNKHELKQIKKERKAELKKQAKVKNSKSRLFVINFHGDIRASAINSLREEITAILLTITAHDEVLIR